MAMTEVRMHVVGYPDSDEEERAELASRLREEIQEHGIDEVSHPQAPPPPGSKGGALEWAQLVVTLAGTAPPLAMAIQGWLGRHPRAAVTLEIEGDRLTLEEASPAARQRLLEAFLARHGGT
jgi:Effector Associated Constant Component 1